jgi:hypothetical protein
LSISDFAKSLLQIIEYVISSSASFDEIYIFVLLLFKREFPSKGMLISKSDSSSNDISGLLSLIYHAEVIF